MDRIGAVMKTLRAIWASVFVVIAGYVFFLLWLHPAVSAHPDKTIALALGVFALTEIPALLFFKQSLVGRSAAKLREDSSDTRTLMKFRNGYIICFCMCFAISVYGLIVGVLGDPITWAAPFFVVAFALLLATRPVPPAES